MKRKIIFVVDGEVGYNIYFEDEGDGSAKFQRNAAHYACLTSNPEIIEVPAAQEIIEDVDYFGWGYKDGKLTKPTE